MTSARVLVAIVTHNSARDIAACLSSLKTARATLDIVIYDNASADGTLDRLPPFAGRLNIIRSQKNIGFGRAVNCICGDVRDYDYILLANPDTELRPTTIDALLDLADQHPEAGLYGGRMLDDAGQLNPVSCLAEPSIAQAVAFAFVIHRFKGLSRLDPDSLGGWDRRGVREVPVLTAGMLLVRARLWESLGGFDESYFLYGEDVEFCRRARRLGARAMFTDQAVYTHRTGASSATRAQQMESMLRGKAHVYRRMLSAPANRLACGLVVFGVGLRAILELPTPADTWGQVWRSRKQWSTGWPP